MSYERLWHCSHVNQLTKTIGVANLSESQWNYKMPLLLEVSSPSPEKLVAIVYKMYLGLNGVLKNIGNEVFAKS